MKRTETHVRFLDHLRGVAILMVFAYHCLWASFGKGRLPWRGWSSDFRVGWQFLALQPATFGWAGVAVFFVISGFCIHLSYLRGRPGDWRGFFTRRFFRIYPPYFIAMIVMATLLPYTRVSLHGRVGVLQLVSHALLLHNCDGRFFWAINPSFWTIAVEAQLYLIYPVLVWLTNRLGWQGTMLLLGAAEVAMRAYAGYVMVKTGHDVPRYFFGSPLYYWYSWGMGAALAEAYAKKEAMPFRRVPVVLALAVAVGCWWVRPLSQFTFLLFALATAGAIARLSKFEGRAPLPRAVTGHMALLGRWSYSFYLLHQPLVQMVPWVPVALHAGRLGGFVTFWICMASYPVVFGISGLYHRFCELPSMALGKLLLRWWLAAEARQAAAVA